MPLKLKIKWYDYDKFYNETSIEDYDDYDDSDEFIDIPGKVPLEGDEEKVKEGNGLTILTPNKLLTRLTILLALIKAGKRFIQI